MAHVVFVLRYSQEEELELVFLPFTGRRTEADELLWLTRFPIFFCTGRRTGHGISADELCAPQGRRHL